MRKVYAFLLMIAAACGGASAQPTIYGYRTFQRSAGDVEQNGPVKFDAKKPANVTLIANQSKLGKVYAGTYYNYKWYAQVTKHGTQSTIEGLYTIDMNDGTRTLIASGGTRITEMTVDYTTGTVYGHNADYLMTVDLKTGKTSQIGAFNLPDGAGMLTLACSLKGEMYGISTNDNFYKIDKATGAATLVGATGINAAYISSMDFDRNTGILYWINTGTYSLYTVDVTTGDATYVGSLGDNADDSVQSMFIPYINVAKGAPDRVTNRLAEVVGTTVKLSWKNPENNAQGNPLLEITKVMVYRDGEKIAEVKGKPGESASYEDQNVAEGNHAYEFVPVNRYGEGGKDTDPVNVTIGDDRPGAVNDLKVVTGDLKATISWTAPTTGMTGGKFNPENLNGYKIVRSDSKDVLATLPANQTSYTDTPKFGRYTYTVCAYDKSGDGVSVTSPTVLVKPDEWIVMTSGVQKVEVGKTYKFYDGQGPNAYYANSQNDTLTIMPSTKNALVKCAFSLLKTDTYGDFLYVFNGASVKSPLIGKFSSETVPEELKNLESTSEDGALTFVFTSDVMARDEGWEADVTVVEKMQNNLVAKRLSGNANPSIKKESVYTLTLMNKGIEDVAAADYKVVLKDGAGTTLCEVAGVALKSMESGEVKLSYTPAEAKKMSVYAEIEYAADKDLSDNKSNELSLNILGEGSALVDIRKYQEGDEYGISVVPISFMSNEAVSETIYYKDEINIPSGKLEAITYYFLKVGTTYKNTPLKIYMGETDATNLDGGAIPANQLKLVFDGTIDASSENMALNIPLTTPYDYKGGNLVVMAYKKSDNGTSYDVSYKGIYGKNKVDPNRTRYASTYGDDESLDINADFGYSASTNLPDTSLLFSGVGTSGVKEVKIGGDVAVYPNPVESVMQISEVCATVEVFDFAGKKVASVSDVDSVDMSSLPAGIYLAKITTNEGQTLVKKVIKK